ncbi:hypothetical protein SDC9_165890 [bioreactor metagenome]|uniref:Uncharacterized protein n=1 Tax=bioreactor metagenome TaxID=1076179 RepID=A0A645FY13_9ZZZZ
MPTPAIGHFAFDVALHVAGGDGLPLVPLALAGRHRDLHLREAIAEVDRQRHQGAAGVGDLAFQFVYLGSVEQQLAVALGCMVVERAELVLGNVRVTQPDLAVVDRGERVRQGRSSGA